MARRVTPAHRRTALELSLPVGVVLLLGLWSLRARQYLLVDDAYIALDPPPPCEPPKAGPGLP